MEGRQEEVIEIGIEWDIECNKDTTINRGIESTISIDTRREKK